MPEEDSEPAVVNALSRPALGMAQVRASYSQRPDARFHDPYAADFLDALANPRPAESVGISGAGGPWAACIGGALVRTCFGDDFLSAMAAAGCRQVVLLAAGLDMRAFRMPWPPEVVLYEIDLPTVCAFKESVIDRHGHRPGCERRVVPADLRADWDEGLGDAGFDPSVPTAWMAEGVLMYLTGAEADRLVGSVSDLSAPGSQLVFDQVSQIRFEAMAARERTSRGGDTDPAGASARGLWRAGQQGDPASWLGPHGWRTDVYDLAELAVEYGLADVVARPTEPAATLPGASWLVRAHRLAGQPPAPRR